MEKVKTATQIDAAQERMRRVSRCRSEDLIRQKGRDRSFNDLMAEIYLEGFNDGLKRPEYFLPLG